MFESAKQLRGGPQGSSGLLLNMKMGSRRRTLRPCSVPEQYVRSYGRKVMRDKATVAPVSRKWQTNSENKCAATWASTATTSSNK